MRGGVLDRCDERGIALIAHSPLGGPRRARAFARNQPLAELALAWLLGLSPNIVAVPGARRPETARSAAHAPERALTPENIAELHRTFGTARRTRAQATPDNRDGAEVVVIMGIPGAGKTRLAESYASRGYLRLNRDERGGALPMPEDLRALARRDPGVLAPTQQMRTVRELEPPSTDEGFAAIERKPFTRAPQSGSGRPGAFVAAGALDRVDWEPTAPCLVFDWRPDGTAEELAPPRRARAHRAGAGHDRRGCRVPARRRAAALLVSAAAARAALAFARAHDVDPARSIVIGASPAHRTLANALGARYLAATEGGGHGAAKRR